MKLYVCFFLLFFSFCLQSLHAQKPIWSLQGGADFTFPYAKDRMHTGLQLDPSTGYTSTTFEPDMDFNASDNLGFNISGSLRFSLSDKLSFSSGLGVQYRSFRFHSYHITPYRPVTGANPVIIEWYGVIVNYPFSRDSTYNSIRKSNPVSNRFVYLDMNIAELQYDFPKGIVSVFAGIHTQLLAWSARKYAVYDLTASVPRFVTVENDHSGDNYSSMLFGVSCGVEYRLSRNLLLRASFSRSFNDIYERSKQDVEMKWNSASVAAVYELNK